MLVDGKTIAQDMLRSLANEVTHLRCKPHMTVFTCAPNFATKKYLHLKTKRARQVGIGVNVIEFPEDITTADVITTIQHACMQTDGVVVQLPLPEHLDLETILDAIPVSMDIDGVHYDGGADSSIHPVAGAIAHIADHHDILVAAQKVVVVGEGRLVGMPVAKWATRQGGQVTVLTKETEGNNAHIADADILILGAGQPNMIKPDMIKPGVIILDAGTSELGGNLTGDAHPDCATRASLMTPVPGGIGPITIAVLLGNVTEIAKRGQ